MVRRGRASRRERSRRSRGRQPTPWAGVELVAWTEIGAGVELVAGSETGAGVG